MKLETLCNAVESVGYGELFKAKWKSQTTTKEGVECLKISSGALRFAHYPNIKGVVVKGGDNTNNKTIIDSVLKYNSNTKNYLVQFTLSINENHIVKTTYYINGKECDKETFEKINPKKPSVQKPEIVFYKKLQDVISINDFTDNENE